MLLFPISPQAHQFSLSKHMEGVRSMTAAPFSAAKLPSFFLHTHTHTVRSEEKVYIGKKVRSAVLSDSFFFLPTTASEEEEEEEKRTEKQAMEDRSINSSGENNNIKKGVSLSSSLCPFFIKKKTGPDPSWSCMFNVVVVAVVVLYFSFLFYIPRPKKASIY